MKKLSNALLSLAIFAGTGMGASILSEQAHAGWAPKKPVEFVIMAGKGGGADRLARFIQGIIEKNKLSPKPIKSSVSGGAVWILGASGWLA